MKRYFNLSALFLLVFIVLISRCSNPKKYWQEADKLGTIESYESFLQKYPQSQYVDSAKQRIEMMKLMLGYWEFEGFYVPPGSSGFVTTPFSLGRYGEQRMINYPETIDFRQDGTVIASSSSGTYNSKEIDLLRVAGSADYPLLQIVSITEDELVVYNPKDTKRAYYKKPDPVQKE